MFGNSAMGSAGANGVLTVGPDDMRDIFKVHSGLDTLMLIHIFTSLSQWVVSKQSNNHYTIRNLQSNTFANAGSFPGVGSPVANYQTSAEWRIMLTDVPGRFTLVSTFTKKLKLEI